MFFGPEYLDLLREKCQLSEVIGQKIMLKKQGRELVGLCPFHKEKSPSFQVSDSRGNYHCFGCGAHGDVFSFLTEAYNYPFVDAVKEVARLTNTPLPVQSIPTPEKKEELDQRELLLKIHEEACTWYQQQLQSARGYNARQYLSKRGITDGTVHQFRLGYAGSGNGFQKEFMQRGYRERDLIAAGLLVEGEKGIYDRFRDRLLFPIFSAKGNVIAFGGRVFGDALPKYLNSPETLLFSKKNSLYGSHMLREMTRNQPTLYVVEGYMDVIAMVQAGLKPAVAPLGTALTEEQIQMLWKYCPEPVLCFDGDTAGLNAATRAAERVLPLLKMGCSLNFALLPKGEDPDSLIRSGSTDVLKGLLSNPRSLFDMLWDQHMPASVPKTPEKQALVRKQFLDLIETITDQAIKYPYKAVANERFFTFFRKRNKKDTAKADTGQAQGILTKFDTKKLQRYILFSAILNHPSLLVDVEEQFSRLLIPKAEEELNQLRDEMLLKINECPGLDIEELHNHMKCRGYEGLLRAILSNDIYQHAAFAKTSSPIEDAREGWQDVWYMLEQKDMLAEQREEMRRQLIESFDSDTWTRFNALQNQVVKS
jgi:DNA primase